MFVLGMFSQCVILLPTDSCLFPKYHSQYCVLILEFDILFVNNDIHSSRSFILMDFIVCEANVNQ